MEDFSIRLKKLRKDKGLLQRELADLLNLTRPAISYYESGERFPDQETLKKIADFFDTSIDYLLGRSNDMHFIISESCPDYCPLSKNEKIPPEAQKLLEEFKQFIYEKYKIF